MNDASRSNQSAQAGEAGVLTKERPPAPPAWRRTRDAAIAGLLMLLLVNLAVETFVAGAAVRWVAAALAAATVAAAGLAWRRYSAAAGGWTALFGFLTVLAVAAWVPGGTTSGVVLLGQPTSRILAAVAAAGVILAAATLGRLKFLALPGKAVVGLVALYALWALAWAIVLRTPYPTSCTVTARGRACRSGSRVRSWGPSSCCPRGSWRRRWPRGPP